ncbi:hypothetical protein HDU96_006098 [Phlyctochytrium bullatum]|nr:hypothetical protein HDU96_006098 [Phlyctochytrium bullatum]
MAQFLFLQPFHSEPNLDLQWELFSSPLARYCRFLIYLVAVALCIAATATPLWYVTGDGKETNNIGFFVSQYCYSGYCATTTGTTDSDKLCGSKIRNFFDGDCKLFDGIRALLVIVDLAGLGAAALFIIALIKRGNKSTRVWVLSCMGAAIGVAFLSFVTMCLVVQLRRGTIFTESLDFVGKFNYGGSFIMLVFSWMFGVAAAVCIPFTLPFMTT